MRFYCDNADLRLNVVRNFCCTISQFKPKHVAMNTVIKLVLVFTFEYVVGIATRYGLDGPGIGSRWGRDFPRLSRQALGPTQPPVKWVPGFSPGVKSGQGVTLTPHHLLVPWSRKSKAIPLLPLRVVRSVQSLSACTRVHLLMNVLFYFTL